MAGGYTGGMVSPRHVEAGCQLMWKMMKTAEFFSCCVYTINEAGGIWRGGLWDAGKVLQMLESGGRQDPVPLGVEGSIHWLQQWDPGNWEMSVA